MAGLDPTDALRIAVEEYHFQVRLNADRIHHWLSLNVALLIAAGTVAGLVAARWVPFVIFIVATCTSVLCALGVHAQHGYYRAARDRALSAAAVLGAEGLLRSTPGMRGEHGRRVRVTSVVVALFVLLGVVGATGAVGVLVTAGA